MRFFPWKGPKNLPLRWVLITPFAIEIFLTVGLVGWLTFRNGQESANTLAIELSQKVALSIENHVLNFANTHHLFLQINAAAIRTQNLRVDNLEQLEQYFWQQVQITDTVSALYFADHDGRFILVTVEGESQVYIRNEDTEPLREIYRLDESGIRGHLLKTESYEPRERPWYLAAAAQQQATWSEIYTFAARPILGITPAVPIYDAAGDLQGVLAADITLRQMSLFLQSLDIGQTGEAFIMERSGHLVASSALEAPLISAEVSPTRRFAVQSHIPSIRDAAAFIHNDFNGFDDIQAPQQLVAHFNGVKHFVQIVPIQDGRGLDWLMVVVIPVSDFMAATQNARSSLIVSTVAVAIAIGAIILITYWITKPILIVGKAAQAIAAGQLEQQVATGCVVEINQLIRSFNDMASQLKTSFKALAQTNQTLESQVEQRTAQLQTLAMTDSLTQVFNRRGFDFFLNSTWEEACQTQHPLSLIFCDIDHFKSYNDTYGHVTGDHCLQAIAALLNQYIKPSSNLLVGRYGGEEFVLVLPNTSATVATHMAEEIRHQIVTLAIPHSGSPLGYITASFGVASQIPNRTSRPVDLVRRADNALYTAKHSGRNQIVMATVAPIFEPSQT